MKLVTFCVFCGNKAEDYCSKCQDIDGVVTGYIAKNGEYKEFERDMCGFCDSFGECADLGKKKICLECLEKKGIHIVCIHVKILKK